MSTHGSLSRTSQHLLCRKITTHKFKSVYTKKALVTFQALC